MPTPWYHTHTAFDQCCQTNHAHKYQPSAYKYSQNKNNQSHTFYFIYSVVPRAPSTVSYVDFNCLHFFIF